MAIWPFSRRNKRHTIDLSSLETPGPSDPPPPPGHFDAKAAAGKSSRKRSKRQKKRHLQSTEESPSSPAREPVSRSRVPGSSDEFHGSPLRNYHRFNSTTNIHSSSTDNNNNNINNNLININNNPQLNHNIRASYPSVNQDFPSFNRPSSFSRPPSLFKDKRRRGSGLMRRKTSKRKAHDRERQIRLMASAPLDIPKPSSRRSDHRVHSDGSLSNRDSAGSSMSDASETYTFKVNAFAAWTPRPIIRCVEPPRTPVTRSQNISATSIRRDKLAISDDNLQANKRIENLADDLDAGALRELLERDRRRKEKRRLERQASRDRRLRQRAERDQDNGYQTTASEGLLPEHSGFIDAIRGRPGVEGSSGSDAQRTSASQLGSWLRGPSRDETSGHASMESMQVVNSTDGNSLQASKLDTRPSLAFSQDTGMSLSTNSPSYSPIAQKINSPNSSQVFTQGSTSDISKVMEPEHRLNEQRNNRMNSLSSLLRRGSSRLKRSYRERAQERPSDFSNPSSNESFFKVHTPPSAGPLPQNPMKPFLGHSTVNRSQSKFKEHFGDEPVLQSPPLPAEPVPQVPKTIVEDSHSSSQSKPVDIPAPKTDPRGGGIGHQNSWDNESFEAGWDDVNVPLSQSLASVDSEGSWMSGQFLRRISQRHSNPVRQSVTSAGRETVEEERNEGTERRGGNDAPGHSYYPRFSSPVGPRQSSTASKETSSNILRSDSLNETENAGEGGDGHDETWHDEVGRRPVVVSPPSRPKSTQVLLKNAGELSPISPEEDDASFAEENSPAFG